MNNPPDHIICSSWACEVREDGACESCHIFKLLTEHEAALETIRKLREVIKEAGSEEKPVSCQMFGHYAHNTTLCSRCKVKRECVAWKETG